MLTELALRSKAHWGYDQGFLDPQDLRRREGDRPQRLGGRGSVAYRERHGGKQSFRPARGQQRQTRVVKDMPPQEIAREIVAWMGEE